MPDGANIPGEPVPEPRPIRPPRATSPEDPPLPPSKPLQIFLLVALLITGAAYVEDQWLRIGTDQATAPRASKLRRLRESQTAFFDHTQRGQLDLQHRHVDQAIAEFHLALQFESWGEGYENLGRALLLKGQPQAAFAQFKEGLKVEPKRMSIYSAWAGALLAQGRPEEAQGVCRAALQHDSSNGEIHYQLAKALQAMQQSARNQSRLAAASGDSAVAAGADSQAGKLATEALTHYAKASRNGVDTAEFWSGYGELLNDQKKFAEAIPTLERAVRDDPKSSRASVQLGAAQTQLGHYAAAIASYEKVLSLTPDDPGALNSLALIYATASQPEARSSKMAVLLAIRACDATIDQNAGYMDTLARAYAADGDFSQAMAWEDKAALRAAQLNDHELQREFQARRVRFAERKAE